METKTLIERLREVSDETKIFVVAGEWPNVETIRELCHEAADALEAMLPKSTSGEMTSKEAARAAVDKVISSFATDKERQAFEKWARERGLDTDGRLPKAVQRMRGRLELRTRVRKSSKPEPIAESQRRKITYAFVFVTVER